LFFARLGVGRSRASRPKLDDCISPPADYFSRKLCPNLPAGTSLSSGWSNKQDFYVALAAALIGFVLDLLPQIANYRKLLVVIMPLFIVGWIGLPRFAKLDVDLMATSLGLWLGGIVLLWRLDTVATTPAERNGGSIVGTAMLMALLLAFAPGSPLT